MNPRLCDGNGVMRVSTPWTDAWAVGCGVYGIETSRNQKPSGAKDQTSILIVTCVARLR